MSVILNYIWRGWLIILATVLTLIFSIPVYALSFSKKNFKTCYFFIRCWCYGIFYGMGFRYDLHSLKNLKLDPSRQYVVIANHTSIMDIMLTCILLPHHPVCFVGKKELVKLPIFGQIYKRVCVMVDRKSPRSRADVYRRCAKKMEEGRSIVIFPEGGVSDDPNTILDPFKDGAFLLASKHHFPIAVFTYVGLRQMFPFDPKKGHPGKVKVILNDIIEPHHSKEELKDLSYNMIHNTLIEELMSSK